MIGGFAHIIVRQLCAPIQDVAIPDLSARKQTFFSAIPAKENEDDLLTI